MFDASTFVRSNVPVMTKLLTVASVILACEATTGVENEFMYATFAKRLPAIIFALDTMLAPEIFALVDVKLRA